METAASMPPKAKKKRVKCRVVYGFVGSKINNATRSDVGFVLLNISFLLYLFYFVLLVLKKRKLKKI